MRHAQPLHLSAPLVISGRDRHPLAPVIARCAGPWLDLRLAAGAESWRSPVYAARARQLTGRHMRRTLARSLERLIEEAEEERLGQRGAVIWPSRARVREARPIMLTMAARLRRDEPVDPNAVAALKQLLTDGAGPVYTHGDPGALKHALLAIDDNLDARD